MPWPGGPTPPPAGPRAPRKPGANWWQEPAARTGQRPGAPVERSAGAGRALAVALGLSTALALLIMMLSEFDDDVIGVALIAGLVTTVVAGLVGVAVRRPPRR